MGPSKPTFAELTQEYSQFAGIAGDTARQIHEKKEELKNLEEGLSSVAARLSVLSVQIEAAQRLETERADWEAKMKESLKKDAPKTLPGKPAKTPKAQTSSEAPAEKAPTPSPEAPDESQKISNA